MMHVSLHVLLWNSERDLPDLLRSLRALTYPHIRVRMLDNGSVDGSVAYMQEHAPEWLVGRMPQNIGFAAGHNHLIAHAMTHAPCAPEEHLVVVVNADMVLDPECVTRMVAACTQGDARIGAVQPCIYRAVRASEGEAPVFERTTLDSTGLVFATPWRMEDRGAGHEFDASVLERPLFGPCGAFCGYRMSAILDVLENGKFFDEDFFSYREDCDVALRLFFLGWDTAFAPDAVAWHYRGMFGVARRSLLVRLRDRLRQQGMRRAWSARNQVYLLIKHWRFCSFFVFLRTLFYESGSFLYSVVFERETRRLCLRSYKTFFTMFTKRRALRARARRPISAFLPYVRH